MAKERGCSHTYVAATGIYSARVFEGLGFSLARVTNYSDFRDSRDQLYLTDTREHTQYKVFLKAH